MADQRIVTEVLVDNTGVKTGVDGAVSQLKRLEKQFGDTSRNVDVLGSQSAARMKANYEKLVASMDPITDAQYRHSQEFQRQQAAMDRAVKNSVITRQQADAALSALNNRQIADLNRLKNAALEASAANQNARSARAAGVNIGYQFQDIGMMALTGQNPFTLALQQGPQIVGILQSIEGRGASAGAAIMTALRGLVSWQTVAIVGLTGLVAAVIQFGQEWLTAGETATRTLEEENTLLDELGEKYGAVLEVIRQTNAEREKQANFTNLGEGTDIVRTRIYGDAMTAASNIQDLLSGMDPGTFGLDAQKFNEAREEIAELIGEIEAFKANGGDAAEVQAKLNALLGDSPGLMQDVAADLKTLTDGLQKMSVTAEEASRNMLKALGGAYVGAGSHERGDAAMLQYRIQRRTDALREQYDLRNATGNEDFIPYTDGSPTPTARPSDIERLDDEAEHREKLAKEREREAKAAEQLTKQLEREAAAREKVVQGARDNEEMARLRVSTYGTEESARTRLLDQLKIEQDLRSKGKDLTGAQAEQYRAAATAASEYAIQLDELDKKQAELNEQQQFFGDLFMDGLNGLISGGEKLEDVMKRIGLAIADAVLKAALFGQGPLASFFGWQPKNGQQYGGIWGDLFPGLVKAPGVAPMSSAPAANILRHVGGAGSGKANFTGVANSNIGMTGDMAAYAQAIKNIESGGGNYGALGPVLANGNQALGAYQIMQSNLPSWSRMSFGRSIGRDEFLRNPAIQDRIFTDRFGASVNKYGNPQDAASVWFTGRPQGGSAGAASDILGTTGNQYVSKFTNELQKLSGVTARTAQATGQMGNAATQAGGGLGQLTNVLSQFPAAPGGGGQSPFGFLGNLFGGAGNAISPSAWSWVSGGGAVTGLWANGGAFLGGNVIPFARGGIVGSPTLFPMAKGMGLMGEAGPEAIMPLQRGPDGKLGVAGGGVKISVHNYAGVNVETREGKNGEMELLIKSQDERTASQIANRGSLLHKAVNKAANPTLRKVG